MSKLLFKVNNLTKTYGKDLNCVRAIKSVDLEIYQADFIAITGLSGSGKTTFLNILAGLIPATEGEVFFNDTNILNWKDNQLSAYRNLSLGYVMQNFGLINSSNVLNNVLLPIKKNTRKYKNVAIEKLSMFGVEDKVKSFPYQLSGGQKQRIAIVRALAMKPEVMLFDEPTSALDPISTTKIEELIRQLQKEYSIVIVTHNMQQDARISDYTGFFYQGVLEEFDKTDIIFTTPRNKKTEDYITGKFG